MRRGKALLSRDLCVVFCVQLRLLRRDDVLDVGDVTFIDAVVGTEITGRLMSILMLTNGERVRYVAHVQVHQCVMRLLRVCLLMRRYR